MVALMAVEFEHETAPPDPGGLGVSDAGSDRHLAEWLRLVAHDCGFDRQPLQIRRHRKVYRPGDHDRALYLVNRGLVATMVPGRGSRKCIISLAGPGDVFGELALASTTEQQDTALVMRDASLLRVPAAAVLARMGDPQLCGIVLAHFAHLLATADHKLAVLLKYNAEQRLAVALINLAARGYRIRDDQAARSLPPLAETPPLTQQELAELIGTTRTRVCTFLCQFRERGLIAPGDEDCYVIDAVALRAHLISSFAPSKVARGDTADSNHPLTC